MKNLKVIFILSAFALSACSGNGRSGFKPGDGFTGRNKNVVDADTNKRVEGQYTISGFKSAYEALEKKIGSHNDIALANAVLNIKVTGLDARDVETTASPLSLLVEIKLNGSASLPASLKLKLKLSANGKGLSGIAVSDDRKFELSAFCFTTTCKRIELRLKRFSASIKGSEKEIGALVSRSRPALKLIKPSTISLYSDRGLRQLEALASQGAEQNTFVVVRGSSAAEILVRSAGAKTPLLRITADLIDTENVVTEVNSVTLEGGTSPQAKLVGNDSSTGDLMFELISGPAGRREAAVLLVEKDPNEIEIEEQLPHQTAKNQRDLSARAKPNTGLFPTSASNMKGMALAHDFESYSHHDRTQAMLKFYYNKDQKGVRNVFSYTHNVSPYIVQVFEKMQLTPEFAYLLPVESAYLKGNGTFNAQQVTGVAPSKDNQNPSAYGPWQIVNRTALDIRKRSGLDFNILFIRNKRPDPNDDRGFLVQSTYMAAHYLKTLVNYFPQDAGLAIMAYHAGEGAAGKALNKVNTDPDMRTKLQNLSKRNITLELVEKYKMIGAIHRNYAFSFLAWREMGQNASRYGLNSIPKINSENYKKRLSRPNGPVPL